MKSSLVLVAALALNLGAPFGRGPGVAATYDEDWQYLKEPSPSKKRGGRCKTDDARDPLKPKSRSRMVYRERKAAAKRERDGMRRMCHQSNGDTDLAGKFHKTLPHNYLGQVDEGAYAALLACINQWDVEVCELVPAGYASGYLINPLGGVAVDMMGPSSSSVTTPPVPSLGSAELAAQLAECYWMALVRDIPFSKFGDAELTRAAARNLAAMEGYTHSTSVSIGPDGIDPASQLFRSSFVGVETGPYMSQLLVKDFSLDSITATPKQTTFASGIDYMTNYKDWLYIQNGGKPHSPEADDPVKRYIRNGRDLSRLVYYDIMYTEAFRGVLILLEEGAINNSGFNGAYAHSKRQKGFVNFGLADVMRTLGNSSGAMRSAWYQKWNVHMMARPEALGGLVHNLVTGALDGPRMHESLMENWELLELVGAHNAAQNEDKNTPVYLLSQAVKEGSPAHPSYPAGHAVQNGAFATVLKALVGLERGKQCFHYPVYPDDDGLELLEYEGDSSGNKCLTFEGEINKLGVNVSFGRSMCGVHYRGDSTEGMLLGEVVGVRMLHQEIMSYPEWASVTFRLFQGKVLTLNPDGTFNIDGEHCEGKVFTGPDDCGKAAGY